MNTATGRRHGGGWHTMLVSLLLVLATAGPALGWTAEPLRIGVLSFRPKAETRERWQPTADYLSASIAGQHFEVVPLNYPELEGEIASGGVEFVLTNPSHYIRMQHRYGLSRVATLVDNSHGEHLSQFGGVVLVRADSPIKGLDDLRGRLIATPNPASLGGYQVQAVELLRHGLDVERDTRLLRTGMPHDRAVAAVLSGQAEVAFVRTGVMEAMIAEGKLRAGALRVLAPRKTKGFPFAVSTALYPEWPFAVMPQVPDERARTVAAALMAMPHAGAVAAAGGYHGWTVPADYEGVRRVLEQLRLPPYEGLPSFTLGDVMRRYAAWSAFTATLLVLLLMAAASLYGLNRRLRAQQVGLADSEQRYRTLVDSLSEGVVLQDANANVMAINPSARQILGCPLDSDPNSDGGVGLRRLLAEDGTPLPAARHPATVALREGRAVRAVVVGVERSDGVIWLRTNSVPLFRGQERSPYAVLLSFHDISAWQRAERQVRELARRNERLLFAAGEGIYGVDMAGRATFVNPAAAAMLGVPAEQLMGTAQHERFHHQREDGSPYPAAECPIFKTLRDGRERHVEDEWFVRADGEGFPVSLTVAPLEEDGHRIGAVVVFRDLSARRADEQRIELLVSALSATANAVVITDTDAILEWANPAFESLTGYAVEEAIGRRPGELVKSGLQDQPFYELMWKTILNGESWHGEVVNRRKDGNLYHEELTITPVRDATGQLRHFVGVKQDVTARKAAETALRTAQARLTAIIRHFPGGVLVEDHTRHIALLNQEFCDMFGIPIAPELLIGTDCSGSAEQVKAMFVDPDSFVARILQLINERRPALDDELPLADGRVYERDYLPVPGPDKEFIGHLWLYRDISERKERERELNRLATTDNLTGLGNRRVFLERLEQELLRVARYGGQPATSLLMLDLDHFKAINDRYGHGAGDAALCQFARLLRSRLRASDAVGRMGGEEFAVLLPNTPLEGAVQFAEQLRVAVAASVLVHGDHSIRYTVSIGVAVLVSDDREPDQPLGRADAALYEAKAQGRDRVVCHAEHSPAGAVPAGDVNSTE